MSEWDMCQKCNKQMDLVKISNPYVSHVFVCPHCNKKSDGILEETNDK